MLILGRRRNVDVTSTDANVPEQQRILSTESGQGSGPPADLGA